MAKASKTPSTPKEEKKRYSFIINTRTKKKIDFIAWSENKDITEVVEEGLNDKIDKYEKKNGSIQIK